MRHFISAMLVIAGIIHLLPLSGVISAERLAALYGGSFADPNLAIVMRHRAVLFGLLGLYLVVAAFVPAMQPVAFVAGLVSVTSFLWLAWAVGGYNAQIARIVAADLIALGCLLAAIVAYALTARGS